MRQVNKANHVDLLFSLLFNQRNKFGTINAYLTTTLLSGNEKASIYFVLVRKANQRWISINLLYDISRIESGMFGLDFS